MGQVDSKQEQTPLALDDLKVVELPALDSIPFFAGSMAGKALADLGAEVLKIEPKTGSQERHFGPFKGTQPNPETRALHLYLNTNKQSVTLDLLHSRGHELLMELLAQADIVLNPNTRLLNEKLGTDWRSLCARFPRLVVVSITYFGTDSKYGDLRGGDLVSTQMSGVGFETPFMQVTDPPNHPPLKPAERQSDYLTGYTAATAAMIAIQGRKRTGRGQHVDVNQWLAMVSTIRINVGSLTHDLPAAPMNRRLFIRKKVGGQWLYPCRDGWVSYRNVTAKNWDGTVQMLGNPEWTKDELFKTELSRLQNNDALEAFLVAWFAEHGKEEIFEKGQAQSVPCFPVYDVPEVVNNPQYRARDFFVESEHPIAGRVKMPGPAYKMGRSPARVRHAAPRLGEHNQTILSGRLRMSVNDIATLQSEGVI